jgi:Fe-S-cluster containining protein
MSAPTFDTARLHLKVLGQDRTCEVPLPIGPHPLTDILPAARALSHEHAKAAIQQQNQRGKSISCGHKCAACCRHLVGISQVEALSLVNLIDAMPPERQAVLRQRFAAAVEKMEHAGLLDPKHRPGHRGITIPDQGRLDKNILESSRRYFALQIDCPFLEEESCTIYENRPLVCREYHVTSPAQNCSRHFHSQVDELRVPVRMADIVTDAADRVSGIGAVTLPLVLALEWISVRRDSLSRTTDGVRLFEALMAEMDRHFKKEAAPSPRVAEAPHETA